VIITAEIPADAEAVYHELLERLGPAERAELVRLLVADGSQWHDYYTTAAERASN
jgi:hypothetical protein